VTTYTSYDAPAAVATVRQRALLIGVVALAVSILGGLFNPTQFYFSYLLGFMFVLGIALGSLALLLLQHLTGGSWGIVIRRPLEAASRSLPLVAVLFLPVLLGIGHLYSWSRPEVVATDSVVAAKTAYLNVPFFVVRAVVYFGTWGLLAWYANKWSLEQDRATAEVRPVRRFSALGAGGILAYGLTITFASMDWVMSLDPHWFSTIFGILFMGGQALSALAFAILAAFLLTRYGPLTGVLAPSHFHDLGKLLLAFVMLWAYFSFSQYMIIWFGNLPEEIPWYLHRTQGGWHWIGGGLVVLHFAVPFLLLLPRANKRRPHVLAIIAVGLLFMRLVDLFWLIAPENHPEGFTLHWMDILLPLGLASLFVAVYAWQLQQRPVLPIGEPELEGALAARSH
jgi:hypothetical protein